MPRYQHYIWPANEVSWPQWTILLGHTEEWTKHNGSESIVSPTLDKWCYWHVNKDSWNIRPVALCEQIGQDWFWKRLESTGKCLVVCANAATAWAAFGLYNMIESGELTLVGHDVRVPASDKPVSSSLIASLRARAGGYLVMQNPPNIAKIALDRKRKTWITWLDVSNYGLAIPDGLSAIEQVEYLFKVWHDYRILCSKCDLGGIAHTAASQTIRGMRRLVKKDTILAHCHQDALDLEARSLYGGRCECYRIGEMPDDTMHLDFRCQYGSIMQSGDLPVRLCDHCDLGYWSIDVDSLPRQCTTAHVRIDTDEPVYPVNRKDLVIWPTGRFDTVLAWPELRYALARGHVKAWKEYTCYQVENSLSAYAGRLIGALKAYQRTENKPMSRVVKTLIVALAGKLGQREWLWEECDAEYSTDEWGEWYAANDEGEIVRYRCLGGLCQREYDGGFAPDAVPAMAAFITSEGRIRLWRAQCEAGRDQVYYSDTDSIICSSMAYDSLRMIGSIDNEKVGFLRPKGGPYPVRIVGIKHYVEDGKIVASGHKIGTCHDAGDGKHLWIDASSTGDLRRHNHPSGNRYLVPYADWLPYKHGVVLSNGTVEPFHLEEY